MPLLCLCYAFAMLFLCFSYAFAMLFLCFCYAFAMPLLCFSYAFPMLLLRLGFKTLCIYNVCEQSKNVKLFENISYFPSTNVILLQKPYVLQRLRAIENNRKFPKYFEIFRLF